VVAAAARGAPSAAAPLRGGTFFGAPSLADGPADVVFLGAPYDRTDGDGSRTAPGCLRRASLAWPYACDDVGRPLGWWDYAVGRSRLAGVRLADAGDVPVDAAGGTEDAGACVERAVAKAWQPERLLVMVGGEHPLTRPALRAVAAAIGEPGALVLLDAHPDRGPSHLGATYPWDAFVDGVLDDGAASRVVVLGARDLCHPDHAAPRRGVEVVGPTVLRGLGPAGAAALLPEGAPRYVSLDVDVLDPAFAPGTTTPVTGGLSVDEVGALLEALGETGRVVGFDVMELDPSLDVRGASAEALLRLTVAFADAATRGRTR